MAAREPHTLLTLAETLGRREQLERALGNDADLIAEIAGAFEQFGRTVDFLAEAVGALNDLDTQRQEERAAEVEALTNRIESVTRILQSHLGHNPTGEL